MRILITNDDGIHAKGLIPLIKWAQKLGDVTVVAPKVEQSGKSHGIEILKTFEVKQIELEPGIIGYAVDSTPADCVRFAILGMKQKFDLVISGINKGLNIGRDILYSGTVGAVFEAACLDHKAIAVSTEPSYYDKALNHMDEIYDFIIKNDLLSINGIYNINIPNNGGPFIITYQGGPYFSDEFDPRDNDHYQPIGKCVFEDSNNLEFDTDATMHGYISVMPLTIQRANMEIFHSLRKLNP